MPEVHGLQQRAGLRGVDGELGGKDIQQATEKLVSRVKVNQSLQHHFIWIE